jgi:hypothetical protein
MCVGLAGMRSRLVGLRHCEVAFVKGLTWMSLRGTLVPLTVTAPTFHVEPPLETVLACAAGGGVGGLHPKSSNGITHVARCLIFILVCLLKPNIQGEPRGADAAGV